MSLTEKGWFALVKELGYRGALTRVEKDYPDLDFDDIPGINQTLIENVNAQAPLFDESYRSFFAEMELRAAAAGMTPSEYDNHLKEQDMVAAKAAGVDLATWYLQQVGK